LPPPRTREAVATDTPASAATSRRVTVSLARCGNPTSSPGATVAPREPPAADRITRSTAAQEYE
jgi:hypothetical protein